MIKIFFISIAVFVGLDAIWFEIFMGDFARAELSEILNIKNGLIEVKYLYAIGAYIVMGLASSLFLAPKIKGKDLRYTLIQSALMGFILYGIFDFTNMALLKNYSLLFLIMDIAWGTVLYMLVGAIIHFLPNIKK